VEGPARNVRPSSFYSARRAVQQVRWFAFPKTVETLERRREEVIECEIRRDAPPRRKVGFNGGSG